MIRKFYRFLKTSPAAKSITVVFIGNAISAILSFAGTVLIARVLGPEVYGLIAICLAVMATISEYGDLGISASLTRLVSYHIKKGSNHADSLLRSAFILQVSISLLLIGGGYFISPILANAFFRRPELIPLFRLTFLAISGIIIGNFVITVLQTRQKFYKMVVVQTLPNLFKIIGFAILFYLQQLFASSVLIVYILGFYISFLIGFSLIPKSFLRGPRNKPAFREIFHFSKWVIISVICYGLYRRIDVLMLGRFLSPDQVGVYAAVLQLTIPVAMLSSSATTVLFPKASAIGKRAQLRALFKKTMSLVLIVVIILFPFAFLGKYLIPLFYGDQYLSGAIIFPFLFLQAIVRVLRGPFNVFAYAVNKPNIYTFTDIGRIIVSAALLYVTIPRYGIIGAALTVLLVTIFFVSIEGILITKSLNEK